MPEEESQMVREAAVAYAVEDVSCDLFCEEHSPCQYTVGEVKTMLRQNREDYQNGRYHTMSKVDSIMDGWV